MIQPTPNPDQPKGTPSFGFELHHAPAKGMNPSFAEVRQRDVLPVVTRQIWTDIIRPFIERNTSERTNLDIPDAKETVDRFRNDVNDRFQTALDDQSLGTSGAKLLKSLAKQQPPFDYLESLANDRFSHLNDAVDHFSDGLTQHPIGVQRQFVRGLRDAIEQYQFETQVELQPLVDRLAGIARTVRRVESNELMVPDFVRTDIVRSLRDIYRQQAKRVTRIHTDDFLRENLVSQRRQWSKAAERVEKLLLRRVGRLETVEKQLRQRERTSERTSSFSSNNHTIQLPTHSAEELLEQFSRELDAPRDKDFPRQLCQTLESRLNRLAVESGVSQEPIHRLEYLIGVLQPSIIADELELLIRQTIGSETTIWSGIARTIGGAMQVASDLNQLACQTMGFAGRTHIRYGVAATKTAYLIVPTPETEDDGRIFQTFKEGLNAYFKRIEFKQDKHSSIRLMTILSGFVPGTATNLMAEAQSIVRLDGEHDPRLFGPNAQRRPTAADIKRHGKQS